MRTGIKVYALSPHLLLAACVFVLAILAISMTVPASADTHWERSFQAAWQEAGKASPSAQTEDAPPVSASLQETTGAVSFFILYCLLLGYIWLGRALHVFGLLAALSLFPVYDVVSCRGCILGPDAGTAVILFLGFAWLTLAGRIITLSIQSRVKRFQSEHSGVEQLLDAVPPLHLRSKRYLTIFIGCFFMLIAWVPFMPPPDVSQAYSHQGLTNGAAVAFTVFVTAIGLLAVIGGLKNKLILTQEGFSHQSLFGKKFRRWDEVERFYAKPVYSYVYTIFPSKIADMLHYDLRGSEHGSPVVITGFFFLPAEQLAQLMNHWRERAPGANT